ncbi:MAG: ABC transporter ATP-binding protein [Sphingobacteriales bacterium]|nr:MAG: ABC transporter ATP-binding protein [Sphingobacteriales bacterium]
MFKLDLQNVGKRYRLEWIFQNVSYSFESGTAYAVLGGNGTGKSTLLQIICGSLMPTKGTVLYQSEGKTIENTETYRYLSLAAPYLELIEEFSLVELIRFQLQFKPFVSGFKETDLIELLQLSHARHKRISFFSSGMKQRVKLGLAVLADCPLLLLDEPTTNLDSRAVDWYLSIIEQFAKDKLVVIASNQPVEYSFCQQFLTISDFSPNKIPAE